MDRQSINTLSSGPADDLLSGGEKSAGRERGVSFARRGEGGEASVAPGEGGLVTIVAEADADVQARDRLLDRAMGPRWRRKSSEKLRRGRMPCEGLAFVAKDADGSVVGTVRLWDVAVAVSSGPAERLLPGGEKCAGRDRGEGAIDARALLLGPLAVDPAVRSAGIGSALMRRAIEEARRLGHRAIILVGDPEYYGRFGFDAAPASRLAMPGPFEKRRLLALELEEGALDGAAGILRPAGRTLPAAPALLAA